jgi:SAM-dependent methyltransferase
VEAIEIRRLVELEERHWWYRERRAILAGQLRRLGGPGQALDIGAAGGGNTRVLVAHGWEATATDLSEVALAVARERGLRAVRADARRLPMEPASLDLVLAFDVLEHVEEDHLVTEEMARVLRPGGRALVAVPCDMALWSAHDEAVGHVRRYTRASLCAVMEKAGLRVERVWSWNVLLRPVVAMRRRRSSGSDLEELPGAVNAALTAVVFCERFLPVRRLPGVTLFLRARRD